MAITMQSLLQLCADWLVSTFTCTNQVAAVTMIPRAGYRKRQGHGPHHWVLVCWCQFSCYLETHPVPVPGTHAAPEITPAVWIHVCSGASTGRIGCPPQTSRCTAQLMHQSNESPADKQTDSSNAETTIAFICSAHTNQADIVVLIPHQVTVVL